LCPGQSADAALVARAPAAIDRLPSLELCANVTALLSPIPPPASLTDKAEHALRRAPPAGRRCWQVCGS
jgi:hypothetical protein